VEDPGQRTVRQLRLGAVLGPRLDVGVAVIGVRRRLRVGRRGGRRVVGHGGDRTGAALRERD
jgi:hypothetical protein